jgi:hypothetical protein
LAVTHVCGNRCPPQKKNRHHSSSRRTVKCLSRRFLTPTFRHCPQPPLRVSIACDQFHAMGTFTASALFGSIAWRLFSLFLQIIFIRFHFASSNHAPTVSLAISRGPEFVLLMDIDV